MPAKTAGTFQFKCPKCAAVLRIPLSATKFRCPYHNDVYHVKLEHKNGKKSKKREEKKKGLRRTPSRSSRTGRSPQVKSNNRRLPQKHVKKSKGIYSQFEREMGLRTDVENKHCDGPLEKFRGNQRVRTVCKRGRGGHGAKESEFLCFDCKRRLCDEHSGEIHAHPERAHHVLMRRYLFDQLSQLFCHLDNTDGHRDTKVSCHVLSESLSSENKDCDRFVKKEKDRLLIQPLLKANAEQFGKDYCISFEELAREAAKFITQATLGKTMQDAETLLEVDIAAGNFGRLNCCSRLIIDFQNWYSVQKRNAERLHLWAPAINSIQSNFGGNISTYFIFLRFLWYVNLTYFVGILFFMFLPTFSSTAWGSLNYRGLLIGVGLEDTFMFYGGYTDFYAGWNMMASYVIVTALCVLYGLAASVGDIGGQSGSMRKEDEKFKWCDAVFCGMDFQLSQAEVVELGRNAMATQLLVYYRAKTARKRQMLKAEKKKRRRRCCSCFLCFCFNKKFMGRVFSFAIGGFNVLIVYFATSAEQSSLLVNLDGSVSVKYFIVPGAIAVMRVIVSKVLKGIVKFENYTSQGVSWNHYYARVFALRIGYIFALVAGAYAGLTTLQNSVTDGTNLCFETSMGMVFYRALLCDYVVEMVLSVVFPFLKVHVINRIKLACCAKKHDHSNDIALSDIARATSSDLARASITETIGTDNNDALKEEFDIADNLVDLTYRQMIVWSAIPFCPFIVVQSLVLGALLLYVKKLQVFQYSRRPKRPMAISRQHRYFRFALIVSIVISLVPFTYWLRQTVYCGPHNQTGLVELGLPTFNVSEVFGEQMNVLPQWLQIAVSYITNAMLLWMIVFLVFIYVITLSNKATSLSKQLSAAEQRLKMETTQRQKLLAAYGIQIGGHEGHGRDLFKAWRTEINSTPEWGRLGDAFGDSIHDKCGGDMYTLCRYNNDQLLALIKETGAQGAQIDILKATINAQRHHIVMDTVRRRTRTPSVQTRSLQ